MSLSKDDRTFLVELASVVILLLRGNPEAAEKAMAGVMARAEEREIRVAETMYGRQK